MPPNPASAYAVGIVLPTLGTLSVALRWLVRRRQEKVRMRLDDILIYIGMVLVWMLGIMVVVGTAMGLVGTRTRIDPNSGTDLDPTGTKQLLQIEFAFFLVERFAFAIIKISIVIFYRSIFVGRNFAIASWCMIALLIAWLTAFFLSTAFACGSDITKSWNSLESAAKHCINIIDQQSAFAISNMITGVMILVMPLVPLWRLQMAWRRKLAISGIFLLGAVSVGAVVAEIGYAQKEIAKGSLNLNGTLTACFVLSMVSAGTAVIAACLPTLGPVFTQFNLESTLSSVYSFVRRGSYKKRAQNSGHGGDAIGSETVGRSSCSGEIVPGPKRLELMKGDDVIHARTTVEVIHSRASGMCDEKAQGSDMIRASRSPSEESGNPRRQAPERAEVLAGSPGRGCCRWQGARPCDLKRPPVLVHSYMLYQQKFIVRSMSRHGSTEDVASKPSAGTAYYTHKSFLRYFYDLWVLKISNKYIWRCQTRDKLLPLFRKHLSPHHLDIGVGSGFYLASSNLPENSQVTLADLSLNSLEVAATTIRRANPSIEVRTVQQDVLAEDFAHSDSPLLRSWKTGDEDMNSNTQGWKRHGKFESISMFFLLHCLPGPPKRKGAAVARTARLLEPERGVLNGATVLGSGVEHNLAGRILMYLYNRLGIFSNQDDGVDALIGPLQDVFNHVDWKVENVVLLFTAWDPKH